MRAFISRSLRFATDNSIKKSSNHHKDEFLDCRSITHLAD